MAGAAALFQHKLQLHGPTVQLELPLPAFPGSPASCTWLLLAATALAWTMPSTTLQHRTPRWHHQLPKGWEPRGGFTPRVQGHSPTPVPPPAHQPQQGHCSLKHCHGSAMHGSRRPRAHSNNCKRQIIVVV